MQLTLIRKRYWPGIEEAIRVKAQDREARVTAAAKIEVLQTPSPVDFLQRCADRMQFAAPPELILTAIAKTLRCGACVGQQVRSAESGGMNRLLIVGAGNFGREVMDWALAVPQEKRDWELGARRRSRLCQTRWKCRRR